MLRSSLRLVFLALMMSGLSAGAWAETSNWGLSRTPDSLTRLAKQKPAPRTGGGGGGSVRPVGPAPGPPAKIVIVTQPPGTTVKLETGHLDGNPENLPDQSRYKYNLQGGKRRLVVSKEGWQTREMVLTIETGDNSPILVALSREDYSVLFKELIEVYSTRYEANHDDVNALLHLLYLHRLTKNYREVDRLTTALKNNPRIDVREETLRISRFAMEQMATRSAGQDDAEEEEASIADQFLSGQARPGGIVIDPERVLTVNHFFYPGFTGYLYNSQLANPDEAMPYLKGALETELNVALLWYDAGLAFASQGKYQEAYNAMTQAYTLDPDHAWVLSELSYLSNLVGRMTDTRKMVTDAEYFGTKSIQKDPKYLGGYLNLVTYYQIEGRYAEAKTQVEAALLIDPNNPELYGIYGDVLAAMGQLDQAEDKYNHAIQLHPNDAYGLYGLGRIAEARGQVNQAKSYYGQAATSDPTFAEPLIRWAYLEETGGDKNLAIDLFQKVTKINPGIFDPWFHIGGMLLADKQFAPAAQYFYQAFQLNPQEPWTLYSLGLISQQLGDNQKALDFYDAFLGVYSANDEYTTKAQSFVKSAKTLFNLTPSRYAVEGAEAGDEAGFFDEFFAEDEEGGGDAGDLANNFKPDFIKDEAPEHGNIKSN